MGKLAIYNMAISLTGGRSFLASLSQVSPAKDVLELWYDNALGMISAEIGVPIHRKDTALILAAENDFADDYSPSDPAGRAQYAYILPADMAFPESVYPADYSENNVDFEIAGGRLLTSVENAVLRYRALAADSSGWSSHLTSALAHFLAGHLAASTTGKQSIRDEYFNRAFTMLARAHTITANESQQRLGEEPSAILDSRRTSGCEVYYLQPYRR